jgi:hypothetical protein
MLKFLENNPEVGWSYYPVNGSNWLNQPESNGILKRDWASIKLPALVGALHSVEQRWPLTITAGSATSKYGQPIPAVTPIYAGLKYGQSNLAQPPVCSTTARAGTDAGTYVTSCSGAADPGYDIAYQTGKLQITPAGSKTVLLSSSHKTKSTYGQAVTFNARVSSHAGTPEGSVAVLDGTQRVALELLVHGQASITTTDLSAGARQITAQYVPALNSESVFNYVPTSSAPVTRIIAKAQLTITASKQVATYGLSVPPLSWFANFVNGDTAASMTRHPVCRASIKLDSEKHIADPAGTYPITCRHASDPNYAIHYAKSTLTVKPAAVKLRYTGPKTLKIGKKARLSASMTNDTGAPVAGRNLLLTVDEGRRSQWCRAGNTDARGSDFCTIKSLTLSTGKAIVVVQFSGDAPAGKRYYTRGVRRTSVLVTR